MEIRTLYLILALALVLSTGTAAATTPSAESCAAQSPVAAEAIKRRASVADSDDSF